LGLKNRCFGIFFPPKLVGFPQGGTPGVLIVGGGNFIPQIPFLHDTLFWGIWPLFTQGGGPSLFTPGEILPWGGRKIFAPKNIFSPQKTIAVGPTLVGYTHWGTGLYILPRRGRLFYIPATGERQRGGVLQEGTPRGDSGALGDYPPPPGGAPL